MKSLLKKAIEKVLAVFAKKIIGRYHPIVIAITGSVGKTTTKEAIFAVLRGNFSTRATWGNYNNDIGLPLTVIGSENPGRLPISWLLVLVKALKLLVLNSTKYPVVLVLEMGADRPGDINRLCKLVKPSIGIITEVSETHTEFFGSINGVAEEKSALVKSLPQIGCAVLNYDNEFSRQMSQLSKAKTVFFGLDKKSDVWAENCVATLGERPGILFDVHYKNESVKMFLPGVVGTHLVYSALAAISVGIFMELDLAKISAGLKNFEPQPGRMRYIEGIKKTFIIDDTYNASPLAMSQAIDQLMQFNAAGNTYAVLGDMRELGVASERSHLDIGTAVGLRNVGYLITVGELARDIVRGATKASMSPDRCFSFSTSAEAGRFLQTRIKPGDIVLVKGSRAMKMELVVKELMAHPEQSEKLLAH